MNNVTQPVELTFRDVSIEYNHNAFEVRGTVYLGKDIIEWQPFYEQISIRVTLNEKLFVVNASVQLGDEIEPYYDTGTFLQRISITGQRAFVIPDELSDQLEMLCAMGKKK